MTRYVQGIRPRVTPKPCSDKLRQNCVSTESWTMMLYTSSAFRCTTGWLQTPWINLVWAVTSRPSVTLRFTPHSFYLREQVQLYVDACLRQGGSVLHFDATGTVVKKINDQKPVLYYCLIPDDANVPILEFLSCSHTYETITYILELFNRHARQTSA